MEEIWKFYKDTSFKKDGIHKTSRGGIWEVSNFGRVRRNGEIIELKIGTNGYFMCGIGLVHRAVAKCFIPNPENKPCIDHINCNKLDNRTENLRWVTHKENMANPITKAHNKVVNLGRKFPNRKPYSYEYRKRKSEHYKGRKREYDDEGNIKYIFLN